MPNLTITPPAPPARSLYTHRTGLYEVMIGLLRYLQGLARFFAHAPFLRPDLKVLDAGCGTGAAALALHAALAKRGWQPALAARSCPPPGHFPARAACGGAGAGALAPKGVRVMGGYMAATGT